MRVQLAIGNAWARAGMLLPPFGALLLVALILWAGREPHLTPPPSLAFAGLPVSGSAADSQRAGFTKCVQLDGIRMRCRRDPVMVLGQGPYEAALDLTGSDGSGGFNQVTLWKNGGQEKVYSLVEELQRRGWAHCETSTNGRWGDQDIYTHPGAPVRVSMDLSYYGKRRVRFIPLWNDNERGCTPQG